MRRSAGRTGTGRIGAAGALVAAVVAVAMSGCSAPSTPGTTPSAASTTRTVASPTASPVASGPLRCDDLVDEQQVVAAFTRSGTTATGSITAASPYDGTLTGPIAVTGAGGLACAWDVTTSAAKGTAGTLLVQVLPGAASQWSALMYGDAPTDARRTFAGITAAATCGDPGCGASAVVGSSWVTVDMMIPGYGGGQSALGAESDQAILTGAAPAIGHAFTVVQRASAAQLDLPRHPGSTSGTARCEGILRASTIAPLLSSKEADYQLRTLTGDSWSISGAASHDLGSYDCFADGSSLGAGSTAELTVAPGQAWAVRAMDGDGYSGTGPLRPTRLTGAAGDEFAETTCVEGGTRSCTTIFSLGDLAIQVADTKNATRIAEAIIAQAR